MLKAIQFLVYVIVGVIIIIINNKCLRVCVYGALKNIYMLKIITQLGQWGWGVDDRLKTKAQGNLQGLHLYKRL